MDMQPFRAAIQDALKARDWTLSKLGRETGIQPGVISRWLNAPEGAEVSRPSPRNLAKLATAIGTPHEDLMRMCGYLPGEPRNQVDARRQAVRDQLDRWLTAVGPDYEDVFWEDVKAHGNATVQLIEHIRTAVSAEGEDAVNRVVSERPERGRKRRPGPKGPLTRPQRAAKSLLAVRPGRHSQPNKRAAA